MTGPLQFDTPPLAGAGDLEGLLREHPALLRAVLDATPARVVVLDPEDRCIYLNHEFFAFTKLHPKQVLGRHISQLIGEETFATYRPMRARIESGQPVRWEGWTELRGFGRRYIREHLVPVRGADGALQAIVVMSLDQTALAQREAELQGKVDELQATEALKSSIVDHALAALVSTDADGRIVEWNPAAERMFGRTRDAVLGLPVAEVMIPPRHRDAHTAGMQRAANGEPARIMRRRIEMSALRADGSEFPVEMVLWRTMVGSAAYYTASLFDLTEREHAAREIERQREQLRQSEKLTAMGSLLAGVAHELNNPLAIVMGRASLLEAKCDDPALRADIVRIREAAERCGRIVRTFLGMARQKPAEPSAVMLGDMVRGAVDLLQYNLRSGGVTLELRLADGLPPVLADADRLGQVVLNLLINAQQALSMQDPPRVVRVETGVEVTRPGRLPRVWLRVADNGPGVAADVASRIFDPFFTTKAEGSGTGLGLAVSRAVAREHGGELALEATSPFGRGASFRLSVPIGRQAEPDAAVSLARALPADAAASAGLRVLLVDDEPELVDLMRDVFEAAGYEVASAETGAVALELLGEARFDAVVSDLRMPEMDGPALWRAVAARWPGLSRRMVFVTGDTLSPGAREFLRETGQPCVEKPFTPARLVGAVQALLASE
jgi:PAS domain S-box-containing protein